VDKVDLHVVGVSFEKENQEMQLSQKAAEVSGIDEDEEHVTEAQAEAPAAEAPVPADDEDEEEEDGEDTEE